MLPAPSMLPVPDAPTGTNVTDSTIRRPVDPHWVVVVALAVLAATCSGGDAGSTPDLAGTSIEVVAVWQDAEASAFEQVLDRFEEDTGASVTFTSTGGEDITQVLDDRIDDGDPPDVAVLPQPGLLRRYALAGDILPIDDIVGEVVDDDWAPVWRELGTVDGRLYGVWFKAANKSLVWYSLSAFEAAGVVPPDDLDGLAAVATTLAARGSPAFSLTGAPSDAWTLTDWFENVYIRIAGADRYDALAERRLAWTDPTVAEALGVMAELLGPGLVTRVDGPDTTFPRSVAAVFATEPAAAMVMEGDFVPGVVPRSTSVEVGVDVDAFAFPGLSSTDRVVVGGGDAAVLMAPTPGGEALIRYLASTEAAQIWAGLGGFISPNESVDLRAYPDATARRTARSLLEAGDGFRFDLSDLQPVEFGGTTGAGMWAELTAFIEDPTDVEATMGRLEAAAAAAWGEG